MNIDFETQKSLLKYSRNGTYFDILDDYLSETFHCVRTLDSRGLQIRPFDNKPYPECYVFTVKVMSCELKAKNDWFENSIEFFVKKGDKLIAHWRTDQGLKVKDINIIDQMLLLSHMQEFLRWREDHLAFLDD